MQFDTAIFLVLMFVLASCAIVLIIAGGLEEVAKQDREIHSDNFAGGFGYGRFGINERMSTTKVEVSRQEFMWAGGNVTLKCRATMEGVVC